MSNTATITKSNTIVAALVRTIKYADKNEHNYADYIAEFGVTAENVKDHAVMLADLAFPDQAGTPQNIRMEDGSRPRTQYGNRINTIKTGLKRNLAKADKGPKVAPDRLAALVKAAERAVNDGHTPEQIMAALAHVLDA